MAYIVRSSFFLFSRHKFFPSKTARPLRAFAAPAVASRTGPKIQIVMDFHTFPTQRGRVTARNDGHNGAFFSFFLVIFVQTRVFPHVFSFNDPSHEIYIRIYVCAADECMGTSTERPGVRPVSGIMATVQVAGACVWARASAAIRTSFNRPAACGF